MRSQKIQFLDVVIWIEQGAAFGGAGLMIESERSALVGHVDRTGAQQIDQPRQHRPERAALQPRALGEADDRRPARRSARTRQTARAIRSLSGVKRVSSVGSGGCIAGFASAAKQSIIASRGEMNCFAEPVIGRAFARPGGSQRQRRERCQIRLSYPAKAGYPVRRGLSVQSLLPLEYWITRSLRG